MDCAFWLKRGSLAGRSGPDLDPWSVSQLVAGGIGAILSVNDARGVEPRSLAAAGLDWFHAPLTDRAPPKDGDAARCVRALPKALEFIQRSNDSGRPVLVHCRSGKDRTGMVLAAYLCEVEGCRVDDALARVREVRPIAFSAPGWFEFTRFVLQELRTTRR